MIRKFIIVKGVVQGVGFRPFVYKEAVNLKLNGTVNNTLNGVFIDIEGEEKNIYKFINILKIKPPKLSVIESIEIYDKDLVLYNNFKIIKSNNNKGITFISPDIATCSECLKEIDDKYDSRRGNYGFVNCVNCGPRYTIIKKLPYDRNLTSMKKFYMCNTCNEEYNNPLNRRFHAEPTCCKECGPTFKLLNKKGIEINVYDNISETIRLLKLGKIIAVKGIGGFNILCNGKDYSAINKLRKNKRRFKKPLALMMKDIDVVLKYCKVNNIEKEILLGEKKPIVLLKKLNNELPENISFNISKLGVVIPYSPIHHLLFRDGLEVLIFTSGNISGEPIIYKNEEAINKLSTVVDYFLLHDRDINMPIDDSVVNVVLDEERVIRGGRGYYPMSINKKLTNEYLALGSDLKNTISINKDGYIFLSPYIGDLNSNKANIRIKKSIDFFKDIYDIKVKKVLYDNNPSYISAKLKEGYGESFKGIYHHHAHIAACIGENKIDDDVIGVAFDGTGYGEDGNIWGGEFFIGNIKKFKRVAHIKYFKLIGNDNAIKNPWRITTSILYEIFKLNDEKLDYFLSKYINETYEDKEFLIKLLKRGLNCNLTSSIGRIFDGVAVLLGFNGRISYEGEAAIYLEELANKSVNIKELYNFDIIENENLFEIDIKKIILEILNDLENNVLKYKIAMKFHNTIIGLTKKVLLKLRNIYKINKVCLSGGVFQNEILLKGIVLELKKNNFQVFTHKKIPCNDSCISFGQILIGSNK